MNWLFPALLAPAVSTITIFTDKYIVGNAIKDSRGVVLMQSVMGFLVGTLFWVITGFPLLSTTDLLFASASVLIKFAIDATSFAKILSYESWGIGVGGVILYLFFPSIRKAFNEIIRTVRKRLLGIMFLNEGIYVLSKSLSYFAYSIGPVALVSVVGSTQVLFGIL